MKRQGWSSSVSWQRGLSCGIGLLARDRRSLDILSVKKEAKLSASETPGAEKGKGEEDLRCSRLLTVCQSRFGL